jgi:hypothetical protein
MPLPDLSRRFIQAGLWSGGALLLAVTAVFLIETLSRGMELQDLEVLRASTAANTPTNTVQDPDPPAIPEQTGNLLELGMSPADVLRNYGVPSHTKGDSWYYGNSGVFFTNGCVASWDDRPPYPLGKQATPVVNQHSEQARGFICR